MSDVLSHITEACLQARVLRKEWGLSVAPARDLDRYCEQHGVLVLYTAMGGGLSGAFVRAREAEVMLVNTQSRTPQHQRFTLAHELGHLRLHSDLKGKVEDLRDGAEQEDMTEQQANWFAAELLVPYQEIKKRVAALGRHGEAVGERLVINLCCQFGVSVPMILRRLRAAKVLQHGQMSEWAETTDWKAAWHRHAPGNIEEITPGAGGTKWQAEGVSEATSRAISRFPVRYREMALEAYRRGKVTAAKLCELLDLPGKQVVLAELQPLLRPDLQAERASVEQQLRRGSGWQEGTDGEGR